MRIHSRLQRLERRAGALATLRVDESPNADVAFHDWRRRGCVGPLPAAGPPPAKYATPEDWASEHHVALALACRSAGRPDPMELTADECCIVDQTIALFTVIDPFGAWPLRSQARLARYVDVY